MYNDSVAQRAADFEVSATLPGYKQPAAGELEEEFAAAALRPLPIRMKYAFIRTYKPVLDDAPFRSFETMEDYRRWCDAHLPDWLGYGRV